MFNKSIALLHTHTQTHTNSSILFDFLEEIPFFNRGRRSNSVKFQRTPLGRRAHSDACAARPNCRPFLFGRVEKLAKAVGTPPPAICKIMTAAWKECIMRDISRLRAPRGASAAPPPCAPPTTHPRVYQRHGPCIIVTPRTRARLPSTNSMEIS